MNNRGSIPTKILRELYVKSGNRCARCQMALYTNTGSWIGEIAHIEAVNPDGARYNYILSNAQVNAFDNLILVCCNCHKEMDSNESLYTVEFLKDMKRKSECSVEQLYQKSLFTDNDRNFIAKKKPLLINILNAMRYFDIQGGFDTRIIDNINELMMTLEEEFYFLSDSLHEIMGTICQSACEIQQIIIEYTRPDPFNGLIGRAYAPLSDETKDSVLYFRTKLINDINALFGNKNLFV